MIGSRLGRIILPEAYKEFGRLFVDSKNGKIINRDKFQNRILGLVSYVEGRPQTEFPRENPLNVVRVNMDPDQYVAYQLARDKEKDEGMGGKYKVRAEAAPMTKPKNSAASTYRVASRQLSNYCSPLGCVMKKILRRFPGQILILQNIGRFMIILSDIRANLVCFILNLSGWGGLGLFPNFLNIAVGKNTRLIIPIRARLMIINTDHMGLEYLR